MSQYTVSPPFHNYGYNGSQNNGRFYVRSNVYLPNSEINAAGMACEAKRRVGRTQALRREEMQLDQEYARLEANVVARMREKGKRIPLKTALILFAVLFLILSVVLLVQQGNLVAKQNAIRQMNAKITATQTVVADITSKIDEASDPVKICYTAARELDMVPGDSAQAIYLTAPSTRPGQEPIAIRAGND